jgi:hypothetical protein
LANETSLPLGEAASTFTVTGESNNFIAVQVRKTFSFLGGNLSSVMFFKSRTNCLIISLGEQGKRL